MNGSHSQNYEGDFEPFDEQIIDFECPIENVQNPYYSNEFQFEVDQFIAPPKLEDNHYSEVQKISSTLCLQHQDAEDSDEESESAYNNTRTRDENKCTKSIKKRNRSKDEPKRKIKKWSEEDNKCLHNLYQIYKGDWDLIVRFLDGRTVSQCKQHWQRINENKEKKKKQWSQEENDIILQFTRDNAQFNNWSLIASSNVNFYAELQGRNGKQVREHYMNQLRDGIKNKEAFTEEEDKKLLQLHQQYGSKWSQISKYFEGRSEIMIKNRFNKLQKVNLGYVDHFLNVDQPPDQYTNEILNS